MQRSFGILLTSALVLATVGCGGPLATPSAAGHVNVNVVCGSEKQATVVAVAPWAVRPDSNRAVTWELHTSGTVSMRVQATNSLSWPFPEKSYTSSRDGRITATLRPQPAPGTYHYAIVLTCQDKTITIDPDVVVS